MHKTGPRLIPLFFTAINLVAVLLLLASGYGGYINPEKEEWLVSLTLFFPIFLCGNIVCALVWLAFRSRKWMISVLAILVCAIPIRTYIPFNFPQPVPKGSIKVVSYNCYGFGYSSKDHTAYRQMLKYLRHSNADILCAQESHYSLGHKKAVEDATSHWRYKDSVQSHSTYTALTIFSNFPILKRHVIHSTSKGHICVVYTLRIHNEHVLVVNNHFVSNSISTYDKDTYSRLVSISDRDSTDDDILRLCEKINGAGLQRAEQADSLAAYLSKQGDVPVIVCGDFNDSPLCYPHQMLTKTLDDAYTRSGNGPGISYHLYKMFFRLDNILCSHHWRSFGAQVDSRQKMSDHYPIQAWLKRVH